MGPASWAPGTEMMFGITIRPSSTSPAATLSETESVSGLTVLPEVIGNPHPREQAIQIDRAGALLQVGDGFGRKQRLPEGIERAMSGSAPRA